MSPLFIVGVGRSGTSLLQSMLAAHSQLSFLPETAFIRKFIVRKKIQSTVIKKGSSFAKELVARDETLSRVDFNFNNFIDSTKDNIDLECYLAMQGQEMERSGKLRFGDKDPRLIEYLPTVKLCFPDAYIVNIVRDPRDVLSSKKKAAWSAGRSLLFYTFANRVQLKIARLLGRKLFGERYIEIIYEDLISEPEVNLKNLCTKLNLSFEPELLEFGEQAKKLVSDSEISWKKETFGPLLSNNFNKWKKQLNKNEIALTELSCSDAFAIGGYEKSETINELPFVSKVVVYLSYILIICATPLYTSLRYLSQKNK